MLDYMGRGIVDAGGLEVAYLLTLSWGDYPGLSMWTHYNHQGPYEWKKEGERERISVRGIGGERLPQPFLVLKMVKGT